MFTKLVIALALCAATSSCVVVDDNTPPGSSSYGTLTARWTLDGYSDVDICNDYAVDRVDVAIYDEDGFATADAQPFCDDFGVSFDLDAGRYSTEVTLLDFDGHTVSDTVIVDVRVVRDTEVIIDVDFPNSSIF